MFGILSGLSALANLYDRYSTQIEYWERYEGQRIRIRNYTVKRDSSRFNQVSYGIEGTIQDIMSYPPGFVLTDVKEFVETSDFEHMMGTDGVPLDTVPQTESSQITREIERKFVAFQSVDELEFVEDSESAVEPFRDD